MKMKPCSTEIESHDGHKRNQHRQIKSNATVSNQNRGGQENWQSHESRPWVSTNNYMKLTKSEKSSTSKNNRVAETKSSKLSDGQKFRNLNQYKSPNHHWAKIYLSSRITDNNKPITRIIDGVQVFKPERKSMNYIPESKTNSIELK